MNDAELKRLFAMRNEYRSLQYDLRNIEVLCEELGQPQRSFRSALVAGTNGKGSVAWWLAGMVPNAGLFISPHLVRLNERISIGGREIDDVDLEAVMREVNRAADTARGRLLYPPTYFERVAAMAFSYFRDRARYVVLEVGMGGRLDATNVVSQDVSVITNIGLDHQEHLGPTLEDIAGEKAGIIKRHEPVVVGPRCHYSVFAERAGARLIETDRLVPHVTEREHGFFDIDLETDVRRYSGVRLGLAGRHQVENAVLAIRAAEALGQRGWPIRPSAILASLGRSDWPGRLECVPLVPPVLLDGAHNPDAAREVARYLARYHPAGVCLVFGAMKGKAWREMLDALRPHASRVILTAARSERSLKADAMAATVPDAQVSVNLPDALEMARAQCGAGQAILVTGSLFLVGEARHLLVGEGLAAEQLPSR